MFLKDIKQISFDVWNTLITPNKVFAEARNALIWNTYNRHTIASQAGVEKAGVIYTRTKLFLDTAAELCGHGVSTPDAWKHLDVQIRKDWKNLEPLSDDELTDLMVAVDQLFIKYPPVLLDGIVEVLQILRNEGYGLNILSNTNFITGRRLMSSVFDVALGEEFFDFVLFSDEVKISKPNKAFFDMVVRRARGCRADRILHTGDNTITDIQGGQQAGMLTVQVKNPTDLITKFTGALLHEIRTSPCRPQV